MSVREYIGARYVPLIIGEWDITKNYEPLSVVLYLGDSYTSRQAVPAGIQITDETYWVSTGNYNAQVEQYRQEVVALGNKLPSTDFDTTNTVKKAIDDVTTVANAAADALPTTDFDSSHTVKDAIDAVADVLPSTDFDTTNTVKKAIDAVADVLPSSDFDSVNTVKSAIDAVANDVDVLEAKINYTPKMVAIGDSFTVRNNPYADFVWADKVADALGCELYNKAEGSTGFILGRESDIDFPHQLASAILEIGADHKNEVEWVFVYGGYNDYYAYYNNPNPGYSLGDVADAIVSVLSGAHEAFPKAKIVYIPLNWSNDYTSLQMLGFLAFMNNAADACPYVFTISNAYAPLMCYPASDVRYTDNVHPNTVGQRILAMYFLSCLNGNMDERPTVWNVNYTSLATSASPYSAIICRPTGTQVLMNFTIPARSYTKGTVEVISNSATYNNHTGKCIPTLAAQQITLPHNSNYSESMLFKITNDGALVIQPLANFTTGAAMEITINCFIKR